jgi:hypothetical protein
VDALQRELEALKQRQAVLRQELRQLRAGTGSIRILEEKLEKQLAAAKWTAQEIQQVQPGWDELAFYRGIEAVAPKPRGRRRAAAPAAE